MGKRRGVYKILVGKPEGKRPFGRPRCRWEDNIKMNPQEVLWEGMAWSDLAQVGRVAGICKRGHKSSGSVKCGEFLD